LQSSSIKNKLALKVHSGSTTKQMKRRRQFGGYDHDRVHFHRDKRCSRNDQRIPELILLYVNNTN
jgi:hypothetical protein